MNAVQKLSSSNPYSNSATGQDYHVSGWQQFLKTLGFRTGYDAWRENMGVQAAEYQAGLEQKAYDEEYNLPVNQVARMRAAGINPDLDGGKGIDAGSASPMGEDPSTPMQSTGDEAALQGFASTLFSAINTGLGIVSSIQGINANRINNVLGETRVEEAIRSLSKGVFTDSLPDKPIIEGEDSVTDARLFGLDRAEQIIGKMPKKWRGRAMDYINNYWDSAPATAEAFNQWLNGAKNSKGYFNETSMFYSEVPEVMRDIYKEINSLNEDIYKARQNADFEGASADFEENLNRGQLAKEVRDNGGISVAAEDFTESHRASAKSHSISASINSSMSRICKRLEVTSRKGGMTGVFASSLLVAMSMQQMQMLPSLPSVSFSHKF